MRPTTTPFLFIPIFAATLQLSSKNVDVATARQTCVNFLTSQKLQVTTLQLYLIKFVNGKTSERVKL